MMPEPMYQDQVQVILKATNASSKSKFCDRYIFLTKDNPKAYIGRSTKRDARLAAAAKNGWFDSAVMSRNHAKLIYLPASNTVSVVDVGSLHGTYVNDRLINKHQFRRLHQNDTIRFGVPIQKGPETFPPCEMNVTLKHGSEDPQDRPMVFKVPDSSDGEDDVSDIDETVETSVSLIQKAGMTLTGPQDISAIDLTGADDTDNNNDITVKEPAMSTPESKKSKEIESPLPCIPWSVDAEEVEENDAPFGPQESDSSSIYVSEEEFVEGSADGEGTRQVDWDQEASRPHPLGVSSDNVPSGALIASDREHDTLPPLAIAQTAQPSDIHLPSLFEAIPSSSYQPPRLSEAISAESLGAKSGKPEYFQAREHNRRLCFGPRDSEEAESSASARKLSKDMDSPRSSNIFNVALPGNCTNDSNTAALLAAGEEFLCTPLNAFDDVHVNDDGLDETSAYAFELSKKAAARLEDMQPRVTADLDPLLGKTQTVSGESWDVKSHANQSSSKRKSDAISQLPGDELELVSSQTIPETAVSAPHGVAQLEPPASQPVDERPAKRLRRVAEVVGYAALGGVAVMSALIATAPAL